MWYLAIGAAAVGIFKFAGTEIDKFFFPPANQGVNWPTVVLIGGGVIATVVILKKTGAIK